MSFGVVLTEILNGKWEKGRDPPISQP